MNMVPTRWRIAQSTDFATLVRFFAGSFAEILRNADVPLGRIIADVNPERVTGRSPLNRWVFMYLTGQDSIFQLPEAARHERLNTGAEENDLTLVMKTPKDKTLATLEFRADLFDQAMAESWADDFRTLLAGLIAEGGKRPVGAVPTLSPTRRAEVLDRWNAQPETAGEAAPDAGRQAP